MAPTDRFALPFRWEFVPIEQARDRSVHWQWKAYSQTGKPVMTSENVFDTLTECVRDAWKNGYGGRL